MLKKKNDGMASSHVFFTCTFEVSCTFSKKNSCFLLQCGWPISLVLRLTPTILEAMLQFAFYLTVFLGVLMGYQYNLLVIELGAVDEQSSGTIAMIGEENAIMDPYNFAYNVLHEADSIFYSKDLQWKLEHNTSNITVESIPVIGELAKYRLPMQRGRTLIYSKMDVSRVYQFMTGPDGFSLIDPQSTEESLKEPPLLSIDWAEGNIDICRTEANLVWPLSPREFVVCNIAHKKSYTFVSKSIRLSDNREDDDNEQEATRSLPRKQNRDYVRAFNSFALQIRELALSPVPLSQLPSELQLMVERMGASPVDDGETIEQNDGAKTPVNTEGSDTKATTTPTSSSSEAQYYVYEFRVYNYLANFLPLNTVLSHYINVQYLPVLLRRIRETLFDME